MSVTDTTKPIKLFISHASEDKDDFVRPLVNALTEAGLAVWYDEYELTMGDSLLRKISEGLKTCDFGVVVLSPAFFRKKWPQSELDGLFALESNERKIILPVWKDVNEDEVKAYSPILASILGVPSSKGIETVVGEIQRAVQASTRTASFYNIDSALEDFASLDRELSEAMETQELAESVKGVRIMAKEARGIIATLREKVEAISESTNTLRIRIKKNSRDGEDTIGIVGSYALNLTIHYGNNYSSSIKTAFIGFSAFLDGVDEEIFKRMTFQPRFRGGANLFWHQDDADKFFTSDELAAYLLKEIVATFREVHEAEQRKKSS